MAITSVRLQPSLETPLETLAGELQRSKSWVINQALSEYLDRRSNAAERWRETLAALDSVRAGRVVGADKVHAWLKTWGAANEKRAPKK